MSSVATLRSPATQATCTGCFRTNWIGYDRVSVFDLITLEAGWLGGHAAIQPARWRIDEIFIDRLVDRLSASLVSLRQFDRPVAYAAIFLSVPSGMRRLWQVWARPKRTAQRTEPLRLFDHPEEVARALCRAEVRPASIRFLATPNPPGVHTVFWPRADFFFFFFFFFPFPPPRGLGVVERTAQARGSGLFQDEDQVRTASLALREVCNEDGAGRPRWFVHGCLRDG